MRSASQILATCQEQQYFKQMTESFNKLKVYGELKVFNKKIETAFFLFSS